MIIKKALPLIVGLIMLLSIGASAAATANSTTTYNTTQITQAASAVKYNVEHKYTIPNNVTMNNKTVINQQFLYILTTATKNVANNNKNSITVKNISKAPNPQGETVKSGTITKSQYLIMAGQIDAYINANSRLPNYFSTPLGNMNYANIIYMYSKIMNYYGVNKVLPNSVSVQSWYAQTLGPSGILNGTYKFNKRLGTTSYGYVNLLGPYGNGTNKVAIILGVHPQEVQTHIAMLNAITSLSSSLKNVQIWVYQVVVTKDVSNYNLGREHGQDLANAYVVPNINTSFKLVLDCHGNRGNYYINGKMVTNSIYAPSVGKAGSSQEQAASATYNNKIINYTNGTLQHYVVQDGTSPSYVTLPIANKGVPVLIYEQYLNQANYAQVLYQHAMQVLEAINTIFAK
jgi:hypothetical protein